MVFKVSVFLFFMVTISPTFILSQSESEKQIQSEILKTDSKEIILIQKVIVEAPIKDVWKAYTTSDGWTAWASPVAEIDFRVGGTIKTHYQKDSKIGDVGTNILNIVNYVPERVLTLRAELSERWPDVMKEDDGKLMNVIIFEELLNNHTQILSYGVGYRDLPAYHDLMKFFIPANEGLFKKLKDYLEK
jgi:uncharacterized protein YndB with AHSA1/START domain